MFNASFKHNLHLPIILQTMVSFVQSVVHWSANRAHSSVPANDLCDVNSVEIPVLHKETHPYIHLDLW